MDTPTNSDASMQYWNMGGEGNLSMVNCVTDRSRREKLGREKESTFETETGIVT
jgi:hypothetical protein